MLRNKEVIDQQCLIFTIDHLGLDVISKFTVSTTDLEPMVEGQFQNLQNSYLYDTEL